MAKNIVDKKYGEMVLPDGRRISLDDRATRRNNNVMVVGTTGASKTRSVVIPNLLECVGSYIVTDPKGNLYSSYAAFMELRGYKVYRISFVHPENSAHYNPLLYVNTTQEIQELSYMIAAADKGPKVDPYWDNMSVILLNSVIGYLKEKYKNSPDKQTFSNIMNLIRGSIKTEDDKETPLQSTMKKHKSWHANSWAAKQFESVNGAPPKTFDSIATTAISCMNTFDTEELSKMMQLSDIDFRKIGQEKTAVFVEVSDTDRSMDRLINIFFTQAMKELCRFADEECTDHQLPVPVRFIMDDFATNCRIDNFENMISNIRSRKISAIIVLQSLKQLTQGYGESASTIADDCDTLIYMGGNDPETAYSIALRVDRTTSTILHMEVGTSWIMRRGEKPYNCRNFDLDDYIRARVGGKRVTTDKPEREYGG